MRVAINTRFLLKDRLEGIGRFSHEICKRLVEKNPDVEFHFFFDRPYHQDFIYGPNVTHHVLLPPARHPILWHLWFEWAVPRALKRIEPDVFFSPDSYLSLAVNVPAVIVSHDLAYLHFPQHIKKSHLNYFMKNVPKIYRSADKIGCVSDFTRKDVVRQFCIPKGRTFLCHNGCSNSFQPISEREKVHVRKKYSDGCDYFLFVGAIHPRKNVTKLIKAFELYKSKTNSRTKLLIVGRWAWKYGTTKRTIGNSEYQREIAVLNNVKNVEPLMAAAKCLCYVTLFEGFGIPILEAFHCEVPVITSNTSSMPEVAGEAALLVDPTNVEAIAQAMLKIHSDKKLVEALISKGGKQRRKFSWDKSADTVMKQLESVG